MVLCGPPWMLLEGFRALALRLLNERRRETSVGNSLALVCVQHSRGPLQHSCSMCSRQDMTLELNGTYSQLDARTVLRLKTRRRIDQDETPRGTLQKPQTV